MEPSTSPAGWQPDPYGRYEFRYFNGQRWTSDVSVHGERYIDPAAASAVPPGWSPQLPSDRPASRGFALAAFWVAFASFVFAWVPFVFVLGGAGAITAIVFGILALGRVRSGQGTGRGYAVAGIVLSVAALGACVAGFAFTRAFVRELDEFLDVGDHQAQIDSCVTTDRLVRADGSITNQDTVPHSYTVLVGFRDGSDLVDSDQLSVLSVPPGETATFHASSFVDEEQQVTCTIESVTGPNPFDPNT